MQDKAKRREKARAYYAKNKERILELERVWRQENKERRRETQRRSYRKHRAEVIARNYERHYCSTPKETQKKRARNQVSNRIVRGQWPRASVFLCSECNNRACDYHHEDYGQWWNVEPLCRICHAKRHRHNEDKA